MENNLILYSYYRSSASYRVRIALGLKNLKYEYRAVHLLNNGGEQFKTDYKKLNPSGDVPTLVHNGKPLGQSIAIIDYLDSLAPTPRLFPLDARKRAEVLQFCEIINSGVQPLHNLRVLKKLKADFGLSEEQTLKWTVDWIQYGLDTAEAFLKDRAGDFCFGQEPSAADCYLIPHLANADRFKVSLSAYPLLSKIRQNASTVAAFREAAPSEQPDFEKI